MATSVSVPEVSGNIVITGVNGGTTDHESSGVHISVNIAVEEGNGGTRKECACVTGSAPRGTRGGGRGGGNAGRPTRFIWRPARDKRNIPKGQDGGYVQVPLDRWLVLISRAIQPRVAHLEDVFFPDICLCLVYYCAVPLLGTRAEKLLSERLLELKARTATVLRPFIERESGKAAVAEEIDVLEEVISDDEEEEGADAPVAQDDKEKEGDQQRGTDVAMSDAAGATARNGLKRKAED